MLTNILNTGSKCNAAVFSQSAGITFGRDDRELKDKDRNYRETATGSQFSELTLYVIDQEHSIKTTVLDKNSSGELHFAVDKVQSPNEERRSFISLVT